MNTAVIVDAVRTPIGRGRPDGSLATVHPVDLLAQVLAGLIERNRLDPGLVDDVVVGCVSQVGEQSANVGRMAWLAAGLPESVPSVTVERKCGSSQQAVDFAAQMVMSGACDIVVAAGVESMSRVPMGRNRLDADPFGEAVADRYAPGLVSQGIAAELVAARWGIEREEMDAYAALSHEAAAEATDAGRFASQLVPVRRPDGAVIELDETIRRGTTIEGLARLAPAFVSDEAGQRFPEIRWGVTAGNASQISDGASAVLVASEETAGRLGLSGRARFHSFAVCGADPVLMLIGPIDAARRALERGKLTIDQIDHIEINEAFACVPLAWERELHTDRARLNPYGGAIALGHPLGASGARLMGTMLAGLEQSGGRFGLQSMCEAGGMANATIIERL